MEQGHYIVVICDLVNNLNWVKNVASKQNSFILSKTAQHRHPQQYINLYIKYRISSIFFFYMAAQYMQVKSAVGGTEGHLSEQCPS